MQAQAVLRESLRQHRQHPPRILFPREDQGRVVGKTDLKRPSPKPWLDVVLEPNIEHLVPVEVTEQRGNDPAHNRAKLPLEFSSSIARAELKVRYGEGFGGAPLSSFSAPRRDKAGVRGSRDEQIEAQRSTTVGGDDHV